MHSKLPEAIFTSNFSSQEADDVISSWHENILGTNTSDRKRVTVNRSNFSGRKHRGRTF